MDVERQTPAPVLPRGLRLLRARFAIPGTRLSRLTHRAAPVLRVTITLAATLLAVALLRRVWFEYELAPWTRDGRVRADIVRVGPDESGWVARVLVRDNQTVERGQALFELDRARYRVALQQAQSAAAHARALLAQAEREAQRNAALGELIAVEAHEQGEARVQESRADLARTLARVSEAELDLERTVVRAPVNGTVTNLELRPGDYLNAGHQALAMIDRDSLHVDGYFEETRLPRLHVGDRVSVRLMGESKLLYGHIDSIAPAIFDRERTPTPDGVADVNPTFSWVRLAQRVPVRIRLDPGPEDVRLIAGRTATVVDLAFTDRGLPWWQ